MDYIKHEIKKPYWRFPWRQVFAGLSLRNFSGLYDALSFPFQPDDDVRQLAHDFTLTYAKVMNNPETNIALNKILDDSISSQTVFSLVDNVPGEYSVRAKVEALFINTFSQLEEWDVARMLYDWSINTRTYYKYLDRKMHSEVATLNSLIHLLRKWAVLEYMKSSITPDGAKYFDDWHIVIEKYAPLYTRQHSVDFPPTYPDTMPLSDELCDQILIITLDYEVQQYYLEHEMELIENEKTLWEDYVLRSGAGSWTGLEGCYRSNLEAWQIIKILIEDERDDFEQWVCQHKDMHRELTKLPDL